MPLTAGLRDEENERINSILKKLMELVYVPETGKEILENELKNLALNKETLSDMSPENMVLHVKRLHFDWKNAERFSDFLVSISDKMPESNNLKEQAIAIYNYIQIESKTFSFDIFNKIAAAKAGLQ